MTSTNRQKTTRGAQFRIASKQFIQRLLPSDHPAIVVASMGRSGSTLIWDTLREAMCARRFPWLGGLGLRLVTDTAWDPAGRIFFRGVVYKTHCLADEIAASSALKVVFLFGSATDAALSVLACRARYGDTWTDEHFAHLRAQGTIDELGERDVLRFEEQLDGWIGKVGTQRLILHYDSLWDHQEALSRFVGLEVELPARRPRNGAMTLEPDLRARFARTYASLDAKISCLPRCQVLE